jgi:acetate kinase
MRVLVLNPGSSTLKASLVTPGAEASAAETLDWPPGEGDAHDVVRAILDQLPAAADAVGYRVVHGGSRYRSAARVDPELIEAVEALDALAPLHNRRSAAVMRTGLALLPDLPHVACFDTAFHAELPEAAWRYPLPPEWVERWGIRRFGFHGLSVGWSTHRAAELLGRPSAELGLVVAHLGSGCSVTAVDGGRSVDTSMGFTPFEGLMMASRSGSVDPGILLHLLGDGLSTHELADGLAHGSGLRAIAGTDSAREIEARAADGDDQARLALDMFSRRAAGAIASSATALGALDAIVFTGGIGEHSDAVRGNIVRRLGALAVPPRLAPVHGDGLVAAGPPAVIVVAAREDLVIATETASLAGAKGTAAL